MTKTLTEQWREGTLPTGSYYIRVKEQGEEKIIEHKISGSAFFYDQNVLLGIVAPVPSYDEFVQQRDFVKDHHKVLIENMNLKRKLEIATKALERIYQPSVGDIYNFETDELDNTKLQDIAGKALKEMEGVK